ncbi:MAG: type II toxin-antitoxin system VapC family toxin [Chloroflexota bacterium]
MRLDDALRGVLRLGIDTAPLIYLIEAHPRYGPTVLDVARRLTTGEMVGVTTVITLGEVLVRPYSQGNAQLRQRYHDILLHSVGLLTRPIDAQAADRAAALRARYGMRLPDALQIAVALDERCDAFLTNDRRLTRVTELRALVLDDLEL